MNLDNLTIGDLVTHGRLLYIDEPGYRVWLTRNGDTIVVTEEWPDVQALLDSNAAIANDFSKNQKLQDFQQVASVPQWMINQWENEGGRDKEYLRRKLNDPDNAKFRTNGLRL